MLPERLYGSLMAIKVALANLAQAQDGEQTRAALHQLDLATRAWLNIREEG